MTQTNPINRPDIAQVLSEMQALRSRAQGFSPASVGNDVAVAAGSNTPAQPAATTDFRSLLTSAIDQVNEVQKESGRLAESFQRGDAGTTLTDVVIASEKAGVAFEAMTEVRNRLVNAYEDIMNMPI